MLNYDVITKLVETGSKIIDLGSGDGTLFKKLVDKKNVKGVGIEINQDMVIKAFEKGLSVIQGDLDEGLKQFADKSFDYAILNQTLQSTEKPDYVVDEMLRVAKRAIVTFPNFGYWRVRSYLFFRGKMPISKSLPYEWYDTPNIHLMTVKDFVKFCKIRNIKILKSSYLTGNREHKSLITKFFANLFADEAIFVISKD